MVDCHDHCRKKFCIAGEIIYRHIATHENHLRTLFQRELDLKTHWLRISAGGAQSWFCFIGSKDDFQIASLANYLRRLGLGTIVSAPLREPLIIKNSASLSNSCGVMKRAGSVDLAQALAKSPYLSEYQYTNPQMEVCAKVWGRFNDMRSYEMFLLCKEVIW